MIVTEFGKLRYNSLPVGMCASGDIFQTKVDNLISDIEGVKTYIKYVLVLINESFSKAYRKTEYNFWYIASCRLKIRYSYVSFGVK